MRPTKMVVDGGPSAPGPTVVEPSAGCIYPGCMKPAVQLAVGRGEDPEEAVNTGSPLGPYCAVHGIVVTQEGRPEYVQCCPNCGCKFGVN